MSSNSQANSFQLTRHASEGGGNLICRGGILPGHPTRHTVPPTCSGRQVKPSFGWVHAMVAVHGRGEPSKKRHVAMALPACQCQLGIVWTFPHEVPVPASQQAPVGQAKLAAAPPQNASKKPAASEPKPGHPASFPLAAGGGHPNQHKAPSAGS